MFGFTKIVKLMGLFIRDPKDLVFLPASIIFGYFHGFIKLYALFTLKMVSPITLGNNRHVLTPPRHHGAAERTEMPMTTAA